MNTPLSPKVERLIDERLRCGRYKSATEVVEDAFEALTERERFQAIRTEMDHADRQLESREFEEYDENTIQDFAEDIKNRGQARLAAERHNSTR